MRFGAGDELLAMEVVRPGTDLLVATDGGFAKRTSVEDYRVQGRGGQGIKTARITASRGRLVGALVVADGDELLAITSAGGVIRTRAEGVRRAGRDTMGVRLINLAEGDVVVAVARNAESSAAAQEAVERADPGSGAPSVPESLPESGPESDPQSAAEDT
jgi:DNA gyrase subunit A